jgi:hypothetical protein
MDVLDSEKIDKSIFRRTLPFLRLVTLVSLFCIFFISNGIKIILLEIQMHKNYINGGFRVDILLMLLGYLLFFLLIVLISIYQLRQFRAEMRNSEVRKYQRFRVTSFIVLGLTSLVHFYGVIKEMIAPLSDLSDLFKILLHGLMIAVFLLLTISDFKLWRNSEPLENSIK